MKVWVCEHCWDYEGCEFDAVYSSEALAAAWLSQQIAAGYRADNLQVREVEVDAKVVPAKVMPSVDPS